MVHSSRTAKRLRSRASSARTEDLPRIHIGYNHGPPLEDRQAEQASEKAKRKAERQQRKATTPSTLIERGIARHHYLGGVSVRTCRRLEALGILQPVKLNPTAETGKTFYTRANLERVAKAHLVEPEA